MNMGKDFGKACKQAKANAKLDNRPRYLSTYNGILWLNKTPPACGHWLVTPAGEVRDIDESIAQHLHRIRTDPAYAEAAEASGQEIMDMIPVKE